MQTTTTTTTYEFSIGCIEDDNGEQIVLLISNHDLVVLLDGLEHESHAVVLTVNELLYSGFELRHLLVVVVVVMFGRRDTAVFVVFAFCFFLLPSESKKHPCAIAEKSTCQFLLRCSFQSSSV